MKKILVLGGTGFVGRHLCEHLYRQGWHTTVPTRRAVNASAVQHLPRLTVLEADVHDEARLTQLLQGHDAVVNLVAILHGSQAAFAHTHVELPAKLARACAASGVRRVVHISALGAAPDAPSRYLRSKAAGEAALHPGPLDLTILRPSVVFGAGDHFLNLFADMQATLPVVPLAGAQARFQPVWVQDLVQAVVTSLRHSTTPARAHTEIFECVGPQVLTLAELVRLAGRCSGHPRPVLPLPAALGRALAWCMELTPGQPMMSRDNLDSMSVDNVASGQWPDLSALGIAAASVGSVAPGYLGATGVRSGLLGLRKSAVRG